MTKLTITMPASKRPAAVHKVYFNKAQPMPAWLAVPTGGVSWRYWRRIWDAQPQWADVEAIKRIYKEAHDRRLAGEDVQVDHIVPLNGADICGLHVPSNLRIIPRRENLSRSNRTYPGHPYEQFDLFHESIASLDFELLPF